MQPFAETLVKLAAEMIVLSLVNLLPFRRLKSIDRNIKGLRRDQRRTKTLHGRRLDQHERRIDRHDGELGINTKEA